MDIQEKLSTLSEIIKKYVEMAQCHTENSEMRVLCDDIICYAHVIRSLIAFGDYEDYVKDMLGYDLNDLRLYVEQQVGFDLYQIMIEDIKFLSQVLR